MKPSISLVSSLTFCLVGSSLQLSPAAAQVTADGTTNTTVNPDGDNFIIEQGDLVGDNLFHSFEEFSVPTMGSAAFNNASDIANIFSRVTGSNISNIDGLISANGAANLYLINPNGIIFGENARLNLGGSFFASTADSLLFDGGLEFSASNPTAPPLIEVNIPIGLGFRNNPGEIVNRSQTVDSNENTVGLQMQPGKNITFAGGNLTFDGGTITAPAGRVELGGLAEAGTVGLNNDGSLSFPDDIERADIQLTNDASVNVRAGGGGFITVNAHNVELAEGSTLLAGIELDMGSPNAQGRDITVNSTGSVSLINGSQLSIGVFGQGNGGNVIINAKDEVLFDGVSSDGFVSAAFSTIREEGEGNAGNIEIKAGSLNLLNGGRLETSTRNQGNAGNITIDVENSARIAGLTVIDEETTQFSQITSILDTNAQGNPGSINIKANSLTLENGGFLSTSTFGKGSAGNVTLNVDQAVTLSNDGDIFSAVQEGAVATEGEVATVTINAGSLAIADGDSSISTSTFGTGDAGNVTLNIDGAVNLTDGDIYSNVGSEAVGNIGNIFIEAKSVSLTDGAQLQAGIFSGGQGEVAGIVSIKAEESISFAGTNSESNRSGIFSDVEFQAVGDGSDIELSANSISLRDGAFLNASNAGQGNAGKITIDVDGIVTLKNDGDIFNTVGKNATVPVGTQGTVTIHTGSLFIADGDSSIVTSTSGQGDASNIEIEAENEVELIGGNIFSNVQSGGLGNAGNISLAAGSLFLSNGAQIQSGLRGSFEELPGGRGNGGKVNIDVRDTVTLIGVSESGLSSAIFTDVESGAVGNGGDINIKARSLFLHDGAQLNASTAGQGNSGNISLNVIDSVTISGFTIVDEETTRFSNLTNQVFEGAIGNAGNIEIKARSLSLEGGTSLSSSTSGEGNAGKITLKIADTVSLDSISDIQTRVNPGATGNGGNINIQARTLSLANGSEILAETFGEGKAGNIQVDVSDSVVISGFAPFPVLEDGSAGGFSSGLITGTEEDAQGQGGNINVNTNRLQISDGAVLSARSTSDFRGGNIEVNANVLEVTGGGQLITTAFSQGDAGNINLNVSDRILFSGSDPTFLDRFNQVAEVFGEPEAVARIDPVSPFSGIFANTSFGSTGQSGNANVQTGKLSLDNESRFAVNSQGEGNGGSISVSADNLTLNNASEISAATVSGEGGNINLTIAEDIFFKNNSTISARASGNANGGNVTINADNGSIVAFPNQNNDIIANAQRGNGGNINIFTQGIFGLEERRSDPPNQTNDIDASSELGLQGDFSLNTPENEPSRGLVDLPENVVNPEDLISQNACKQGGQSKFTLTGRGGLPATPEQAHHSDEVEVGLVEPAMGVAAISNEIPVAEDSTKIEPAFGWIRNEKGEVFLVGYDPKTSNLTPQSENLDLCQPQGDN